MRKVFLFACMAFVTLMLFDSCKSSQPVAAQKMIKVPPEPTSNFSTPTLAQFIKDNGDGAAVVVRQPRFTTDVGIDMNTVCALIERGLMQNKFNPRDRVLFENALQKIDNPSDYAEIKAKTSVDLIFEITQCEKELFKVTDFYYANNEGYRTKFRTNPPKAGKGKIQEQPRDLTFWLKGFSIEIKVILLQENLIAGVFKYYQQPCLEGCVASFQNDQLRYIDANNTSVEAESTRNIDSRERATREISEFITDIVIPSLFEEMKVGGPIIKEYKQPQIQHQQEPQQKPQSRPGLPRLGGRRPGRG